MVQPGLFLYESDMNTYCTMIVYNILYLILVMQQQVIEI